MINLKTKGPSNGMRFAYLIEPSSDINSDEELYAAVQKNGRAVIREFEGATLELKQATTLTPEDFESTWRGD
jgi:hypothetical protein